MDLYSRLMGIDEVTEYLNEKTNRDFNQDKTLKFIKEKKIPIVFAYEGWATWEFQYKSEYQSLNIQVDGYFNFRNSSDALQIFRGFLEEINIYEAVIYQLNSCYIRNNAPDGIKPKEGDGLLFKTGGRSPTFSLTNTPNFIKIDNSKVGVLKEILEEYLNKMQIEHMDSKTKIEILESTIEQLEAEKATLKYQHTEALAAANKKIKQQEQEINRLNDQLKEQTNKQSDDKELRPNSQTKVAHMLYAILKEHNYDLSPPKGKGTTNDQIVAASQTYKRPITKNFVANWLQRLHEIDIT